MKKPTQKLVLHHETVRTLSSADLARAAGGNGAMVFESGAGGCQIALLPLPRP